MDILKKFAANKQGLVVLQQAKLIEELDLEIKAFANLKKAYEQEKQLSSVERVIVSTINSVLYQRRAVFVPNRDDMRKLVQEDPNWVDKHGMANEVYTQFIATGCSIGIFKLTQRAAKGSKDSMVLEIIDPELLMTLIELGIDIEAQRREAMDFVNHPPSAATPIPPKPRKNGQTSQPDRTPDAVPQLPSSLIPLLPCSIGPSIPSCPSNLEIKDTLGKKSQDLKQNNKTDTGFTPANLKVGLDIAAAQPAPISLSCVTTAHQLAQEAHKPTVPKVPTALTKSRQWIELERVIKDPLVSRNSILETHQAAYDYVAVNNFPSEELKSFVDDSITWRFKGVHTASLLQIKEPLREALRTGIENGRKRFRQTPPKNILSQKFLEPFPKDIRDFLENFANSYASDLLSMNGCWLWSTSSTVGFNAQCALNGIKDPSFKSRISEKTIYEALSETAFRLLRDWQPAPIGLEERSNQFHAYFKLNSRSDRSLAEVEAAEEAVRLESIRVAADAKRIAKENARIAAESAQTAIERRKQRTLALTRPHTFGIRDRFVALLDDCLFKDPHTTQATLTDSIELFCETEGSPFDADCDELKRLASELYPRLEGTPLIAGLELSVFVMRIKLAVGRGHSKFEAREDPVSFNKRKDEERARRAQEAAENEEASIAGIQESLNAVRRIFGQSEE